MSVSYRSHETPELLIEPTHRRIRLKAGETTIADTSGALYVHVLGSQPVYFIPKTDFVAGVLVPAGHGEASPHLGERKVFDLKDAGEGKAWCFDGGPIGVAQLADFVAVEWSAVRWFEEDEEVFRHPRNVYKRVDTIRSSRLVEVFVTGKMVARSNRAVFLFETGLIPRYYFLADDILTGELIESDLQNYCPYKGTASYFHFQLDGQRYDNVVWYYPEPLDECAKIAGLISFYNEKVDEIRVTIEAGS